MLLYKILCVSGVCVCVLCAVVQERDAKWVATPAVPRMPCFRASLADDLNKLIELMRKEAKEDKVRERLSKTTPQRHCCFCALENT